MVEELRALNHEHTEAAANLHQFMVRRSADRTWMLDLIMTVTRGQHDYFSRTFRPDCALETALRQEVTNEDGCGRQDRFEPKMTTSDTRTRSNRHAHGQTDTHAHTHTHTYTLGLHTVPTPTSGGA